MSEAKSITTGVGYYGMKGDISINLEHGKLVIQVRDRRGVNQRTAGVVLSNERMREIGLLLLQLGNEMSLDEAEKGRPSSETKTVVK
jgi:hypothetical protein